MRLGFLLSLTCILLVILIGLEVYRIAKIRALPVPAPVEVAAQPAPPAVAPLPVRVSNAVRSLPPMPAGSSAALEDQYGIQVAALRMAAAGAAIEVLYKVVAPDKAAVLAQAKTVIYLMDPANGAKITMLTAAQDDTMPVHMRAHRVRQLGSFPPSPRSLVAGKTNSILLPNLEGTVRSGSKLVVVVGNSRTDNLTVQ